MEPDIGDRDNHLRRICGWFDEFWKDIQNGI
jgi:hypothetical protein